jgi:ParB-like chromosome segregation protein Spo0J
MKSVTKSRFNGPLEGKPETASIEMLLQADSPRLAGEDLDHIRTLASVDVDLPPIIVHRPTMRVIDGMHRLRAAIMNGRREIEVIFFDGTERDAFVLAVQANISHGLPLSLADREAAAARIVTSHPQWSDRAIAEAAGLAPATVARIRGRMIDADSQPRARIGKDGRVRPMSSAAGRRTASRLIVDRPDASLREIAGEAGISPATVRDVRERMRRGDDPVPFKQALAEHRQPFEPNGEQVVAAREGLQHERRMHEMSAIMQKLRRDPAVRLTDQGRQLLHWLTVHTVDDDEWDALKTGIPPHCVALVADLAAICADEWAGIARRMKRRRAESMCE